MSLFNHAHGLFVSRETNEWEDDERYQQAAITHGAVAATIR